MTRRHGTVNQAIIWMAAALWTVAAASNRAAAQIQVAEGGSNIVVATIARNAAHEPMLQVNLKNPAGNPNAEITQITITAAANGTGDDAADLLGGGVEIYRDVNNDGRLTTGTTPDMFMGSGIFNADNGTATIAGLATSLTSNSQLNLLILYSLGPGATDGESFRARIASNVDILVRNAATLDPLTVSGAPAEGFLRTVGRGTLTLLRIKQTPDGAVAIPNRPLLPLLNLQLNADDVEDIAIGSLIFQDIGSADAVNGIVPGSVRLFQMPVGQTLPPTQVSTALTSASFASDGGTVELAFASPLIAPRDGSLNLWVTADMVGVAVGTIGSKYQIQVPAAGAVLAAGAFSTDPPLLVGANLNGPEWTFNYNPLVFSTPYEMGAILMPSGATDYPLFSFQVRNDPDARSEKVDLLGFTFHADGTLNDAAAVTSVTLYRDVWPFGRVSAADVALASGLFDADNGKAVLDFSATPLTLAVNGLENFVVGIHLNLSAVNGQTARLSLSSRDDIASIGQISQVNGSLVPAPMHGFTKTVGQPRATLTLEANQSYVPSIVAPEAAEFPLLGFRIAAQQDENLLFKGVDLALVGPLDELAMFDRFEIWLDNNTNGLLEPAYGDRRLTSGTLLASAPHPVVHLEAPPGEEVLIERGMTRGFMLVADVAHDVLGDGSEIFTISGPTDASIVVVGETSGAQAEYTSAAPPIDLARTIRNPALTLDTYPAGGQWLGVINGSYGLVGSQFSIPAGEDLIIQRVRMQVTGTLDDSQFVVGSYVWHDTDRDLYLDSVEYTHTFGFHENVPTSIADNGQVTVELADSTATLKRNTFGALSVGLDFAAGDPPTAQAQRGKNVTGAMAGTDAIVGIGARSRRPIEVSNPPDDDTGRTVTFDTGSLDVSQVAVPRTEGPPNGKRIEIFALQLKTDIKEPIGIDRLELQSLGSIDESRDLDAVKVFIDMNRNGKIDGADYLVATAPPPLADNGPIVLTPDLFTNLGNVVYSFPPNGQLYDTFLFCVDIDADTSEGLTIQMALNSQDDLDASGYLSLYDLKTLGLIAYTKGQPPLVGPAVTVRRGAVDLRTHATFAADLDNKPNVVMAPSALDYEIARLAVKATAAEDVNLLGLVVHSSGTAHEDLDFAPLGVKLYKNSISIANFLTSATFSADDGQAILVGFQSPVVLTSAAPIDLRLTLSGTGAGQLGATFVLQMAGIDLIATGVSSGLMIDRIVPVEPWSLAARFGTGRLYVRGLDTDTFVLPIPTGVTPRLQRLMFTASRVEALTLDQMQIRAAGTANESLALENGAIVLNSKVGSNVTPVASAPFVPGDDGLANLRNLNILISADGSTADRYSLDADVSAGGAISGATLRLDLESTATSVVALGGLSAQPVEIVFDDYAGGDARMNAALLTGRTTTLSNGLVSINRGEKNPANATIQGNEAKITLMHLRVAVEGTLEAVTITDVRVGATGSADESSAIGNVYLYRDVDNDGRATSADTLIATDSYDADDGTAHFSGLSLTYPTSTDLRWIVAADLTGNAGEDQTIQATISVVDAVGGTGQLTEAPLNLRFMSPAPLGTIYTVDPPPKSAAQGWEWYD